MFKVYTAHRPSSASLKSWRGVNSARHSPKPLFLNGKQIRQRRFVNIRPLATTGPPFQKLSATFSNDVDLTTI
ncbi:hypothetical protein PFLUV_G00123410 [Perca fluviatilis]|uniref:Uncharacterized protein n=1 Tax=Perca fluviatilis TaxID=8168 RepID=A0A6A5E797_PERFL|nr:hypothetical protein PFLUV_G00123410 [Perca fluviatilis]